MNNNNYILIIICGILFFFTSCDFNYTPEAYTGVSGVVRDKTTDECIPNATIYLLESDDTPGSGYYYKDSLVTDIYGNFEFEFEKIIGYGYALLAKKEHYIEGTALTFVQYGEIKEVLLNPEGFLTVRLKSIGDYGPYDYVNIGVLNLYHLSGNDVDTTLSIVTYGNQTRKIYVFIYEDGINEGSIVHEVYCPAFDTTYYELYY